MRLSDRFDLSGRTAVVAAAADGFGGGCAHALGLAGARVVLAGEDADEGRHLVEEMRADGIEAVHRLTAVRDPEDVERTLTETVQRWGRVDVLVNALDVRSPARATDLSPEDWRAVMDVNLDAVWLWCQTFGRAFVDQGGGTVVTVAAMAGSTGGRPHFDVARGVSKAAVHHLTRALAAEWARYGVRVNALSPGYVSVDGDPTEDPRVRRHVIEDTPMQRLGTLDEITPAVVFLAGESSSFITGQVLIADGGYSTC